MMMCKDKSKVYSSNLVSSTQDKHWCVLISDSHMLAAGTSPYCLLHFHNFQGIFVVT